MTFAERQAEAWSSPPVDDAGYIPAAQLLALPEGELLQVIDRMREARYGGWRNHRGLWRDLMGLDDGGRDVLDFGCGTGMESAELARAGNRVTLADISPANLELASRVLGLYGFQPAGVQLLAGDCLPAGEFDTFHASGVLHHIPGARAVMERAAQILRPGGDARLMLYSDEGWRIATGTEPPQDAPAHPSWPVFVRFFDAVGEWADWYSAGRLRARFDDLLTLTDWAYLTPDRRYLAAVMTRPA